MLDEDPGPRARDLPNPFDERPSAMQQQARKLLRKAAAMAYGSSLGGEQRAERERIFGEAQRLLKKRVQKRKALVRAIEHPATHHTPEAWGAEEGEPLQLFPRALRKTLLELRVPQGLADRLVRIEGEKGQKGEGTKGGRKGGGKKGKGER